MRLQINKIKCGALMQVIYMSPQIMLSYLFSASSRFLHYLDAIHLGLEKRTLQLLAEDFP